MLNLSLFPRGVSIRTMLKNADNSGIIKASVHGIRNKRGTGKVGDIVRVSIRDKRADYTGEFMPRGVVLRSKQPHLRQDGSVIKFDENSFISISNNKPKGSKLKGPVGYEFQHNCRSLAKWIF